MKRTPYTPKDFAWTAWSPSDIKNIIPKILTEKKARLLSIKKIRGGERNFENTVYALEASDYGISETISKINLLQNLSLEKNVRMEAMRTVNIIQNNMIAISRDPKIWQALKDYEHGAWKKERVHLDPASKKLFHDLLLTYKRMGFDLSKEKQKRVQSLAQRIAKLSNEFRQNINAYEDYILVSNDELAGLPDRYKAGLKQMKDGKYKISLASPYYLPFMELAEDKNRRKELGEKFLQKGGKKNMKILNELLMARAEHARLLGYKTHADYRTEPRMAKSGENAFTFLNNLLKKIARAGKNDLNEPRELKRKMTGDKKATLHFYDIAYYGHKLQQQRFNFDSEAVREYFPLAHVLQGMFNVYGTLLGVHFEKIKNFPLWHEDVELYAIQSPKGDILSYFALDLYPREGKYGHASAFGVIGGRATSFTNDEYVPPFATMVANFPKHSATHPSLLSHGEVETLLHEFGHIIHYTLTTARFGSQAGYHTAWDFVEVPSQMLEHWAWDEKSLALLSSHYKTNKPLPKTLIKNLLASKQHMLRYVTLRQIIIGIFDLMLHTKNKPPEPAKLYRDLLKKHLSIALPKNAIFPASFGNLNAYNAGYYSYMWANVYAADMFTRFEKEGIMNKKTGADFKKWILEKGGSMKELELVKGFLGRSPNNKAFLKEIGITK